MSHLPTSPGGRPLELLKVAELRDELRKKGLSLKGVKKELFERLEEAIKKEEQEGIVQGEQGAQEGAHKTSTLDGTEDVEEEDEAFHKTKHKASTTQDMTNACPSDQLPASCPSENLLFSCQSDELPKTDGAIPMSDTHASSVVTAPAVVPGLNEDREHPLSTFDGATPISETHALSGVSAPAGVPGFNEDREQHSAAGAGSVGTNNDVLFVDNAVCESGDAMVLPEKVPSVSDALEPGKEASGTRPEIATSDLKAIENVDGAPRSGVVADVINASIENGNAVGNAVSSNDLSGADCAMQGNEKAVLLAGPEVVVGRLSKSETLIEVSPSETDHKALMQPTVDPGLPLDKTLEEKEVGDLKMESVSVASQNSFEPLAGSKSEELEKPTGDERDMIVDDEKPDAKMEPMETDVGLEGKDEVNKSDIKMEPMGVDAGLVDKHIVISEGNKEMQIDKEDPSQRKSPSKELQLKEVKLEKSSRDYAGQSWVPDDGKSNVRDNADVEDVSQAFINSKRKDTDLKPQEPAKRVRRWNSGKNVAVDALKPLTTDTVKEIILPESSEFSFVAAQRLTPKAVATSREVSLKMKAEPDSGNMRTVPPSTRAPSNSLKIERFVRPFTLKAVKDLLGEFGQCVDFWMDQIKTHCFVTYSSVNEASVARNGLYGKQWPPNVGNFLVAEFVDSNEVKIRSEGLAEKAQAAPPTAPLRYANAPPPPTRVAEAAPSLRSYSNTLPPSRFSRETQLPPVPKKDPELAGLTLEDLFFKTKAKPSIYYLPLTDEQVAEKLAAAKNKQATTTRR